ncbi:hypothetical protein Mlute_02514 [Meiothermus luteus]|jgi:copper(I)-binding protein|uniref:Copper chaperone PCu(A)C n=1 Tax=Meiothermus luteus TaxID=2026184 RepID=A0A399EF14_9DEIN|nr:copper chaperone PCu(A)C [Meiothermus luteus]RIH82376.1 hypothetical protein Mlute_02514 [Meiothermus luteus]RMH57612.1 MAG: copper chaperone PCu(A)C [Deinococcota bacterium]
MLAFFFLGLSLAQHDHSQHGHGSSMPQGRMSPIQVCLVSGWVRQVPSSLRDTTVYFVLQNPTSAELRLIGGESPVAQGVMLIRLLFEGSREARIELRMERR